MVKNICFMLAGVAAVIAALVLGPVLTVWSLNTLFGLGLEFTLSTWFATLWFFGIVVGGAVKLLKING